MVSGFGRSKVRLRVKVEEIRRTEIGKQLSIAGK
jgi:hypothetical protein